jgi:hypothetical protein
MQMEKYKLPLWVPLVVLYIVGIAGFLAPIYSSAIANRVSEQWLGFFGAIAGSVITSAVTVAAIYWAWRGVSSQTRIDIVSREESRIEVELPGLRDAVGFVGPLMIITEMSPTPNTILSFMDSIGLINWAKPMVEIVESRLPRTSDSIRRNLAGILSNIYLAATTAQALSDHDENPGMKDVHQKQMLELRGAVIQLAEFSRHVEAVIDINERRLPKLREEIEKYFRD